MLCLNSSRISCVRVFVATLPDLAMWRLTSLSTDRPCAGVVATGLLLLLAAAACISSVSDLSTGGDRGGLWMRGLSRLGDTVGSLR